jgi:hypothetical protein
MYPSLIGIQAKVVGRLQKDEEWKLNPLKEAKALG